MAEFVLGFATLASLAGPDVVGDPVEDQYVDPGSGNTIQLTTKGLMVWRPTDNWTGFTNGYMTWVNGPYGLQSRLNTELFDWEALPVVVPSPPRRFAVWNGVSINPAYRTVLDIAGAVSKLVPAGSFYTEWLVKAGEGGTYQSAWDQHPLAVSGPDKLRKLVSDGHNAGLLVTPYVVVRGRKSWLSAEIEQIAQMASIAGRVVLNLEPGSMYWNGTTDPVTLEKTYLSPIAARIGQLIGQGPFPAVELACIPRQWVINTLGGVTTIDTWLKYMTQASWETYGAIASDLAPDVALPRVDGWLAGTAMAGQTAYKIPIIQRNMIAQWANSPACAGSIEVWTLDSDI